VIADEPTERPVVETDTPYVGRLFAMRRDTVALGDEEVVRDYLVHPGAVGILALDEQNQLLLVHQYRHAVRASLWEPPAGLLDNPGEDPLVAAQRELYEEAHVRATDWRVLVDAYTSPGCSDEAVRIYLARDLTEVDESDRWTGVQEEAGMPVDRVPLTTVVGAVLTGAVHNPLLVMGSMTLRAVLDEDRVDDLRPGDAGWPERPVSRGLTGSAS
jgi:8-oxo-dGDP phosphatase